MDFAKLAGLVPAVVQDQHSGQVLMVGLMNEAALAKTCATGLVTFLSRTRNELWTKGEASGNRLQKIVGPGNAYVISPRFGAARESIARNGGIIVTRGLREAGALAERIAPEQLACDSTWISEAVKSAGTIFVGPTSVPALGDYAPGSNHVLPTAGAARSRGGLSAADFTKTTTVQRVSRTGVRRLSDAGIALARAEALEAHARSIEVRG